MHPAVKKTWEIGQELKMNASELARHVGLSSSTYHYWLKGEKEPRKKSIEKMQRFIDRYEAGERFEPEIKKQPTLGKQSLMDIENESKRPMYKYIYMLEDKYGSLALADENDPLVPLLRKEVGE